MRFQLKDYGWFIKDRLLPAGTIIDYRADDDFSRLARSTNAAPPLNAVCLDTEAFTAMQKSYPHHHHLLHRALSGVQRS